MKINPKSLTKLKPGVNKKGTGAVRVTLTLKPETVELLRMTGNMSQTVDKFIELIKQGCVSHDGLLNPIPSRSEAENLQSQHTHSVTDAIALPCQPTKPAYWSEVLTRKGMIERGISTGHKLDSMPAGTAIRDRGGRLWWKEVIDKENDNLRPLGSRAMVVWCR